MKQAIIRSKPWGRIAFFPLFGGVFFSVFSVWSLRGAVVNGYPQIVPIIFGSLFGGFALLIWGAMYLQGGFFAIYEDRLVVYSYLRTKIKTIFIGDIVKWVEDKNDDDDTRKSITVYTSNKKYSIVRDDEEYDYEAIKKHLTKGNVNGTSIIHNKENDENLSRQSTNKVMSIFYVIAIAFCSWLIYAGLRSYFNPNDEFNNLSLTEISGAIISTPESHKRSGRSDYSYVRFDLKNYPEFHFYMKNSGYDATYKEGLYRIKSDDSVFIKIPTEDYQKKITKEKLLTFADKTDASNIILVYAFRDSKNSYLSFDDYKAANVEDSKLGPAISLVGLVVLILNLRDWYKRSKKAQSIS